MKTYNCYAQFPEGAYLVAQSNCAEHGMDHTAAVCKQIGAVPHAIIAMIPGLHHIKTPLYTLTDLKQRQ
jgi:hypothetical protein